MPNRINLLVLEDDKNTCLEYKEICKKYDDIYLIDTLAHSSEAICLTEEFHPDAVILDLELQNGSGSGVDYLLALEKIHLSPKPFVLVVTNNVSQTTQTMVRKLGADYIIVKTQADYSVSMVVSFLRSVLSHLPEPQMSSAPANFDTKKEMEDDYNRRLLRRISSELDVIGINPRFKGRNYLRDAIEMMCSKQQTYICNEVAKKYKKTSASVERAMQNAIDHAWKTTDIATLEKHYKAYINPRKGVPTLMEFIYYYVDKVKGNRE